MMIVFDNFTGKHVEFENTPFKEKPTIKACVKEKPIESENMWGIPKKKLLESENIWEIPHSNNAIYERDDEDDEDMYGSENTSWLENRCERSENTNRLRNQCFESNTDSWHKNEQISSTDPAGWLKNGSSRSNDDSRVKNGCLQNIIGKSRSESINLKVFDSNNILCDNFQCNGPANNFSEWILIYTREKRFARKKFSKKICFTTFCTPESMTADFLNKMIRETGIPRFHDVADLPDRIQLYIWHVCDETHFWGEVTNFVSMIPFLALFSSSEKRRLCYRRVRLSVCKPIFSRTMRHTEPIFSASLRLYFPWKQSKFGSFLTTKFGSSELHGKNHVL